MPALGTVNSTTSIATSAELSTAIGTEVTDRNAAIAAALAALVDSAPGALDTLNELAAALADDAAFASTITTALAGKSSRAQVGARIALGA